MQRPAGEIGPVVTAIDGEGLAELARAVAELTTRGGHAAPRRHQFEPVERLDCSNQHGVRHLDCRGYQIEVPVHAVNEEDVRMARGAEHHFRARGAAPAERMRRAIFRAAVRLGFHDASADAPGGRFVDQDLTYHFARYHQHGASVERACERLHSPSRRPPWYTSKLAP